MGVLLRRIIFKNNYKKIMNNKLEDKRLIRLIVSNTMFRAAKVALFLFLNILIWKESNDMQMMFMFNIVL